MTISSRSIFSMPVSREPKWSIFFSYCAEMRTRCRCSLGFWPTPDELHDRLAVLQFEHGDSLSQRIYVAMKENVSVRNVKFFDTA